MRTRASHRSENWGYNTLNTLDANVEFRSIGLTLALGEVYAGIDPVISAAP